MKPPVLILRTAGTNCDYETGCAFEMAGAQVDRVHVNALTSGQKSLMDYRILALPGGFSYGDDIAAGKVLANELKHKLMDELRRFIEAGRPVIGICNGFQVLVKAGLLPALDGPGGAQAATLTNNDSGKFEDRWTCLAPDPESRCIFTEGIGGQITLPVAHGEGKFVTKDRETLDRLRANGQVALRYVAPEGEARYPWNPNGSVDHVAGICDPTGRVFGLMPHPERHCLPTQHPRWTREGLKPRGDGLAIFENAVRYAKET
ncbi:MAG: phosphoribosylformylglycinamidine synthase I [Candidatus Latescibacteria bacterium]|nr:phosphoribosylformylglycinamidine synthase I [Candidatus Latescibacterota bacterium]